MSKDKRTFGVIGLGRFGTALAIHLTQTGADVLALDVEEAKVKIVRAFTEQAYVVSDMSLETLRETGIQNCDTVIVCIGEKIDVSILTTLHVKQLGVTDIIAKATTDDQGTILSSLGAKVVYPERDMAIRLATRLVSSSVLDYISLSDEVDVSEVRLGPRLAGKTIREVNFRKRFGLNVIALIRNGKTTIEIDPDETFQAEDRLAVVGKKENIARFENHG